MSVRKRRAGRWFFRRWVDLPNGTRVRAFGVPGTYGLPNTQKAAEEAERRAVTALLEGRKPTEAPAYDPDGPMTVERFGPVCLLSSEMADKLSTTIAKKQIMRDHIVPVFGKLELQQVTYAKIEDFKVKLGTKTATHRALTFKTINNILAVLRRMLAVAAKRGLIDSVPEIEWLTVPPPKWDFFTFDEADKLEAAARKDPEWYPMIMVATRCGLRQGEIFGLRWDDVDLRAGKITICGAIVRGQYTTPKNHKPREVPLGEEIKAALRSQRHIRGPFVFCDADGKHLDANQCRYPLERACRVAKLRRLGWHDLRHTFASHLVIQGITLNTVRELLGHGSLAMTMRYAHLSPESKRDAVLVLDRKKG